nr:hypothetical protein Iba_chr01bCG6130 [Ipomoea batatas]
MPCFEGDDAESRGKESPPSPTAATSKEEEEAGSGSCWTPSSSIVTSATIAIVARSEAHQEGRQEPLPSIAAGEESAACRLEDGDAGGPHRSWPVVDLREGGGESSSVLPPLSLNSNICAGARALIIPLIAMDSGVSMGATNLTSRSVTTTATAVVAPASSMTTSTAGGITTARDCITEPAATCKENRRWRY